MTSSTSTITTTSTRVDQDTAARVALACAGLSGDPSVTVGIQHAGSATKFLVAVHDSRDGGFALSNLTRQRIRAFATGRLVARTLEATTLHGLGILTPDHEMWPTRLRSLRGIAPLLLWVDGDARILTNPAIAITGTSSPTRFGISRTVSLATALATKGWVIAAGAGSGIDQFALRAADSMRGRGITVAAQSLERVRQTVGKGVAVSELPPGAVLGVRAQRRAKHLLAALTVKTVIVEAGLSSGSLRVAEAAHALDRPVGVVPGPVDSPFSSGCRWLADTHHVARVESAEDINWLH